MSTAARWAGWDRYAPRSLPGPVGASQPGTPVLVDTLGAAARLVVEAAFGADLTGSPDAWPWVDITGDVRAADGVEWSWGRGDEASTSQPAACALTLDNTSGDYSKGPQSRRYPYIRRGTPIRVRIDPGTGLMTAFQGEAARWTPRFDASGNDATVALTAAGVLRRLGQGAAPLRSAYRRALTVDPTVVAYWPCEDEAGADHLANVVTPDLPMRWTGAEPDLASVSDFDCSGPIVSATGTRLVGQVGAYTDTTEWQCSWLAVFPASGAIATDTVLARINIPTGTIRYIEVAYSTAGGGALKISCIDSTGTVIDTSGYLGFAVDGKKLLVTVTAGQDGADVDYKLTTYEPGAVSALATTQTATTETLGPVGTIELNPGLGADWAVGHVSVKNDRGTLEADELAAFRFETATERIARLCDENGIPVEVIGASAIQMGPQGTKTLVELLRECETADTGILSDGHGAGLRYVARSTIEDALAALTLDAATGELTPDLTPVDDDQRIRNRVTASRPRGSEATYSDDTGPAGTAAVGVYEDTVTVNIADDALLADQASWRVHLGTFGHDQYRHPSLPIAIHHDPRLAGPWVAAAPGMRVDVTGIADVRSQLPDTDLRLLVEGASQRIDKFTWSADLVVSPFDPWRIGEVADESGDTNELVMRLSSDGSTLAAAAAAGATSLSVATPSGPLWTTAADDFPLWVEIEGTPVEVTAIAGAASPQTFTVTGSTVARQLTAGATVDLYRAPVIGL